MATNIQSTSSSKATPVSDSESKSLAEKEQGIKKFLSEITLKVWTDENFKAELHADPKGVLKNSGIPFSSDLEVFIYVNTPHKKHFVIPVSPVRGDTSKTDAELKAMSQSHSSYVCSVTWGGGCAPVAKSSEKDPEIAKKMSEVTLKAWTDPQFQHKLKYNFSEVAKEMNILLGQNVEVEIHVDDLKTKHFIIPLMPASDPNADLSKLALDHASNACTRTWGGPDCPR